MKIHAALIAVLAAAFGFTPLMAALPVQIIAQVGDPVPGITDATFSNLGIPSANANGDLVFHATITGIGVTGANNEVIVSRIGGMFRLEARTGDASPVAVGGLITDLADNPVISSTGQIPYRYADTASLGNFGLATVGGAPGGGDDRAIFHSGSAIAGTPFTATTEGIGDDPNLLVDGNGAGFVVDLVNTGQAGQFQGLFTVDLTTGEARLVAATGGNAPAPFTGTFAPPTFLQPTFDVVTVGPDGQLVFTGITTTGGSDNLESFFAFDPSNDSVKVLVAGGQRAPGTRSGRGFDDFGTVVGFGGSDVVFDAPLIMINTGQPTLNFEVGLFQVNAAQPGKPVLKARRDTAAAGPPRGTVYSFFSSVAVGARRTTAFVAELFKRPNGITPPADRAVFACPSGKKPVRLFTGGGLADGLEDGVTIQNPNVTANSPLVVSPGGNQILTPVELSDGDDAIIGTTFTTRGKPVNTVVLRTRVATDSGVGPLSSLTAFDSAVTPLNDGRLVFNGDIGGEESILIGDPPVKPAPNFQPDLICRIPGTGGDNVYENKAKVQRYKGSAPYNQVTDYGMTLQNDGTVDDTIRLSGDPKARFFKWFIAGPPEVEITANVLSKAGRDFTLKPGETVALILRTERANIEVAPKPKKASITFKAVSQGDRKKADQQNIEITYSAP